MKNEVKHTAHSSYRCEYHLVFAPKYRRKVIYKAVRRDIIEIIKKAVQGDESGDHRGRGVPRSHSSAGEYPAVHEYSTVRRDAQEQSALMIFDRHANLKYKYGSRNFWCRGYFVDTVGRMRR